MSEKNIEFIIKEIEEINQKICGNVALANACYGVYRSLGEDMSDDNRLRYIGFEEYGGVKGGSLIVFTLKDGLMTRVILSLTRIFDTSSRADAFPRLMKIYEENKTKIKRYYIDKHVNNILNKQRKITSQKDLSSQDLENIKNLGIKYDLENFKKNSFFNLRKLTKLWKDNYEINKKNKINRLPNGDLIKNYIQPLKKIKDKMLSHTDTVSEKITGIDTERIRETIDITNNLIKNLKFFTDRGQDYEITRVDYQKMMSEVSDLIALGIKTKKEELKKRRGKC